MFIYYKILGNWFRVKVISKYKIKPKTLDATVFVKRNQIKIVLWLYFDIFVVHKNSYNCLEIRM